MILALSLLLALFSSRIAVVFGEVNAYEDPDTLFLLTFQTPVGTFNDGDPVESWGSAGVIGNYTNANGDPGTIIYETYVNNGNSFCFVGLPITSGGALNFKPPKNEWGQQGNFTLEIWATARIVTPSGTGYTYFESSTFGFPKHTSSTSQVSLYSKTASVQTPLVSWNMSKTEILEYSAVSYNGTHFSIYQNGVMMLSVLSQRSLTSPADVPNPVVLIGGKTMSGLVSSNYQGTIYMVRYSGSAKSSQYIANNFKNYLFERSPKLVFANLTNTQCSNLCLNGSFGFGGRKKCLSSTYQPKTKTCTLTNFRCDMSGVVPSPV